MPQLRPSTAKQINKINIFKKLATKGEWIVSEQSGGLEKLLED